MSPAALVSLSDWVTTFIAHRVGRPGSNRRPDVEACLGWRSRLQHPAVRSGLTPADWTTRAAPLLAHRALQRRVRAPCPPGRRAGRHRRDPRPGRPSCRPNQPRPAALPDADRRHGRGTRRAQRLRLLGRLGPTPDQLHVVDLHHDLEHRGAHHHRRPVRGARSRGRGGLRIDSGRPGRIHLRCAHPPRDARRGVARQLAPHRPDDRTAGARRVRGRRPPRMPRPHRLRQRHVPGLRYHRGPALRCPQLGRRRCPGALRRQGRHGRVRRVTGGRRRTTGAGPGRHRPQLRLPRRPPRTHGRHPSHRPRGVVQGVHGLGSRSAGLRPRRPRHRPTRGRTGPLARRRHHGRPQGPAPARIRPAIQWSARCRVGRGPVPRHALHRLPLGVRAGDLRRPLRPQRQRNRRQQSDQGHGRRRVGPQQQRLLRARHHLARDHA